MSSRQHDASLLAKPGDVIDDKYRIERVIGAGGMGIVAEATHLLLRQRVALKFIRKEIARDRSQVTRFLREARACVQLRNEHIARVMDVGATDDDIPYIVMEYLEGTDLDGLVKSQGPLASQDAVDYVLQACVGMAEAHARGIVHRDLKPHNLFLTQTASGRPLVKVLDFGVSKATFFEHDESLTDSLAVVGSPAFMSPEQMEASRDVDARADIWSLGAVLFSLVVGSPPFRGKTIFQLCANIASGKRESFDDVEIPAPLMALIEDCLSVDAHARPANLVNLATRLAPYASRGDALSAEVAAIFGRAAEMRPAAAGPAASDVAMATTVAPESGVGVSEAASTGAEQRGRGGRLRGGVLVGVALTVGVSAAVLWSRGGGATDRDPDAGPARAPAAVLDAPAAVFDAPAGADAGTSLAHDPDASHPDAAGAPDATPKRTRRDKSRRTRATSSPPPSSSPALSPDASPDPPRSPRRHPRDRRN